MSDYLTFYASVEPLQWGSATHTIVRLPADVAQMLTTSGACRVQGEINDHPVNLAITNASEVAGPFLWAGQSLLSRIGIAPGDRVEVRLRPAPDDEVETPDDIALALRRVDSTAAWEALTPGKRRGHLYKISTAKTSQTRLKRIAELIQELLTSHRWGG